MKKADLIRALTVFTAPLSRRIKLLIQRGALVRTSYIDNARFLQIQMPGEKPLADIRHIEPFGFTSHAPDGADVITISLGGDGSQTFVFQVAGEQWKIKIDNGESMMYNKFGDCVHLTKDRKAIVKAALEVVLDTPKVKCLQDFEVLGESVLHGHVDMPLGAKINEIEFDGHGHIYNIGGVPLMTEEPKAL